MHVGQVEFSVMADGLDAVMKSVAQLESMLNKIDGRKINVGNGKQFQNLARNVVKAEKALTGVSKTEKGVKKAAKATKDLGTHLRAVDFKKIGKNATENFKKFGESLKGLDKQAAVKSLNKEINRLRGNSAKIRETIANLGIGKDAKTINAKDADKRIKGLRKINSLYSSQASQLSTMLNPYNESIKAEKASAKATAKLEKQAASLAKNRRIQQMYSNVPKTISGFAKSMQDISQMSKGDKIEQYSKKIGELQTKLRGVSMARANLLAQDTEESKARAKYVGRLGKQYSADLKYAQAQLDQVTAYQKAVDDREAKIAHWGSRMQSFGNAIQNITSPFMNVYRGLTMGLGYQALGKLMQGVTGAFQRYDTMRTYAKVLNELGMNANKKFRVGTDRARTAVDNLEQSVLGLPTGLDEMVGAMRRYAGSTGDVEKATKLAIAANNSYIAGQVDERSKLFTERQLRALAGGAELATTQWDSMQRNAPMAMRAVAKELKISVQDMMTSLKSGKISGEEFLNTFIKVGTEGRIQKAAQKMKMTWDAVSQNISNAFNRMGSNVLETLDDVFKKTTGRDFLQTVLGVDKNGNAVGGGIKDFIDGISKSVQDFIKANPHAITDFFNEFKSIDWKGILQGYAEFAKFWVKGAVSLGKMFGGNGLIKAMLWGNVLGKFVSAIGGLSRGLAGPLAKLSLLGGGGLFARIGSFFKGLLGVGAAGKGLKKLKTAQTWHYVKKTGDAAKGAAKSWTWARVGGRLAIGANMVAAAGSFYIFAKSLQKLQDVKLSWGLVGKIGIISAVMYAMTKAVSKIGAGLAAGGAWGIIGGAVGGFVALLTGGAFDLFMDGIKRLADAFGTIDKIKMKDPSAMTEKIKKLGEFIRGALEAFAPQNGYDAFERMIGMLSPTGIFGRLGEAFANAANMDAIKKGVDALADLGKIKLPKKGKFERFKTFFEELHDMTATPTGEKLLNTLTLGLVPLFDGIAQWSKGTEADTLRKNIEAYGEILDTIDRFGQTKLNGKGRVRFGRAKTVFNRINDFLGTFAGAFEEQAQNEKDQAGAKGVNWRGAAIRLSNNALDIKRYAGAVKDISDAMAEMPKLIGSISRINNKYKKKVLGASSDGRGQGYEFFSIFRNRMSKLAKGIQGLVKDENGQDGVLPMLASAAKKIGEAKIGKVTQAMNKLPKLMEAMYYANQSLSNSDMLKGEQRKVMTPRGSYKQTNTVLDAFVEDAKKIGQAAVQISQAMPEDGGAFAKNMGKLVTGFGFVKKMINQMTSLTAGKFGKKAANLKEKDFTDLGTKLSTFVASIGDAFGEDTTQFMTKAQNFNNAVGKIKAAIKKIAGLKDMQGEISGITGKGGVVNKINTAIKKFNKIKSPKKRTFRFNAVSSVNLDNASSKIQTRWNRVINTWNKIQSKSKTVSFTIQAVLNTASVDAAIAEMSRISGRIQAALNSIKSYYSKTITVSINTVTQRNGKVRPGNGDPYDSPTHDTGVHTGGYISGAGKKPIYRAMGGFAYMMPKGTDTVPAMLTPGEYVVRKKAVDTYGARFFQALNHMDLSRALNSISVRAGQMVTPQASTTINNTRTTTNNDNSRTTHNTNVTVNGLGMASRFVNALQ